MEVEIHLMSLHLVMQRDLNTNKCIYITVQQSHFPSRYDFKLIQNKLLNNFQFQNLIRVYFIRESSRIFSPRNWIDRQKEEYVQYDEQLHFTLTAFVRAVNALPLNPTTSLFTASPKTTNFVIL